MIWATGTDPARWRATFRVELFGECRVAGLQMQVCGAMNGVVMATHLSSRVRSDRAPIIAERTALVTEEASSPYGATRPSAVVLPGPGISWIHLPSRRYRGPEQRSRRLPVVEQAPTRLRNYPPCRSDCTPGNNIARQSATMRALSRVHIEAMVRGSSSDLPPHRGGGPGPWPSADAAAEGVAAAAML